ncbi:hypothetical protein AMTRI_Chr11g158060 [Amborella trichopoda]
MSASPQSLKNTTEREREREREMVWFCARVSVLGGRVVWIEVAVERDDCGFGPGFVPLKFHTCESSPTPHVNPCFQRPNGDMWRCLCSWDAPLNCGSTGPSIFLGEVFGGSADSPVDVQSPFKNHLKFWDL